MNTGNGAENKGKKPQKKLHIRKADLFLLLGIALFSLALFLLFFLKDLRLQSPMLEIKKDGKTVGIYPLSEDREIPIPDETEKKNVCRIEQGRVYMSYADCPDQSCMRSVPIDRRGGTIICLPNRVVLRIIDGTGGLPDAVAE